MSSSLPKLTDYLERVENEHLEFKEARALEDPRNVPRAVCAFLNAKGGDVVIGIRDGGKSLDPIRDPKEAMRSLRDRLVAMISPSIPSGLDIDILDSDHGAGLLVHVPIRPKGTLFALRSSEGRFSFPRRSGDRTLNLDWPDILREVGDRPGSRVSRHVADPAEQVRKMMEEWIGVAEKQAPPLVELGALYLCVRTDPALKVDKIRDTLSAALRDPESIGVRREGWHFSSMDTGRDPKVIRGEKWISTGDQATGFRLLECSSDGRLRFAVRMGREMFWGRTFEETQQSRTLHPYAISETVSACLQLFRHLFGSVAESNSSVWACLRFTNSEGWILRPYRPGRGGFEFPRSWHTATQQDGIASMVARDDIESFNKHPHRLAWLMLTQLYADFDHPEDAVPFYDRQTSRFTYD